MSELMTLSEPLLMGLMLFEAAEENFAAQDRAANRTTGPEGEHGSSRQQRIIMKCNYPWSFSGKRARLDKHFSTFLLLGGREKKREKKKKDISRKLKT